MGADIVQELNDEARSCINLADGAQNAIVNERENRLAMQFSRAAAEIGRLRGEVNPWQHAVDQQRVIAHLGVAADGVSLEEATKQLGELIDWHIDVATDPQVNGGYALVKQAPAPAMPNGVEDLHDDLSTPDLLNEAERIAINQYKDGRYAAARILRILCHRLRAADNRDAAGVLPAWIATWMADREILPDDDGDGISEGALVEALNNHERELLNAIPKAPAAVPAGEAVARERSGVTTVFRVCTAYEAGVGKGIQGRDVGNPYKPDTDEHEAWGYGLEQGRSVGESVAYRARGMSDAWVYADKPVQHFINTPWEPLYTRPPAAQVQAAPQEGEAVVQVIAYKPLEGTATVAWDGERDPSWMRLGARFYAHPSACELGAVLKEIRAAADSGGANEGQCYNWWRKFEAALQHRGDSRGGEE